ncbi:olfactory receptor 10J1-like [Emys orbicularis]|uniref:olfactory receptor 10J1-like n=1 Tax=Emys orbicularis TaxID=82168 RepID=UPI0031FD823B
MAGNLLIVVLVVVDQHLHTPMYFFLWNLSCFETCYTSTILPSMLASLLTGDRTISVGGFKQIINLYYNDIYQVELVITIVATLLTLPPFTLTVTSYVCIICTILRILSTTGRRKAFSTCSSHLIVVMIFYGTLSIVYLLPKTKTLRELSKMFSLFYTVLTPMANPFIYSLRNKEFFLFNEMLYITVPVVFLATPFTLILTSYTRIITTITSHMPENAKLLSLFYTMVTSMLNPIIYSLRNEEVKGALGRRVAGKRLSPLH